MVTWIWRHGDFIRINDPWRVTIYGRSDATPHPGGVRIGTAEIYRQVENIPEIADSLVVGQDWKGDVRVILFVKLAEGQKLTEELEKQNQNDPSQQCLPGGTSRPRSWPSLTSVHPQHEEGRAGREKGD